MSSAVRIMGLALAFAASWMSAAASQAPEAKSFRDWNVACNELLRCIAETQDVAGVRSGFLLRLARDSDEPRWNVVLVTGAVAPGQPFDMRADLDGTTIVFRGADAAGVFGEMGDLHLLGAPATALMAAMAPAATVGFAFLDGDGERHAPRFSLSGLSASLLWIDEKQGRIGSPREAGDLPQGLEPPGAAPGDAAEPPEEVLIAHDRDGECDDLEYLPHGGDFIAIPLNDKRTLHLVPCYAGAYNFAYAAYVMEGSHVRRYWFADYDEYRGWTATDVIVNPHWEGGGLGRLSMFGKGRGLGDCGSTAVWQVSDGDLRMLEFTYKGDCDGQGEPGRFPVVVEAARLR